MLQVTVTLTSDILTPKSIKIIYGPWPTKTVDTNYGIPKLNRLSLLNRRRYYARGHDDRDLGPLIIDFKYSVFYPRSAGPTFQCGVW